VTQKQLAAACGTGIRYIRELEKGKASCELGKALLAAAMLGIRLEALPPPKRAFDSVNSETSQ
jgi:transcriptional regulator with XRE-family HTH domain